MFCLANDLIAALMTISSWRIDLVRLALAAAACMVTLFSADLAHWRAAGRAARGGSPERRSTKAGFRSLANWVDQRTMVTCARSSASARPRAIAARLRRPRAFTQFSGHHSDRG